MTEQLTKSLLREYLSRKNMVKTMAAFDEEFDLKFDPIPRRDLVRKLCLGRLVIENKEKANPKHTLIEMLVDYLFQRSQTKSSLSEIEVNTESKSNISNSALDTRYDLPPQSSNSNGNSRLGKQRRLQQETAEYNIQQKPQAVTVATSFTKSKSQSVAREVNAPSQKPVMDDIDELDNMFTFQNEPEKKSPVKFEIKKDSPQNKQETGSVEPDVPKQLKMFKLNKKVEERTTSEIAYESFKMSPNIEEVSTVDQVFIPYKEIDLDKQCDLEISQDEARINYNKSTVLNQRKKVQQPQPIDSDQLQTIKKFLFSQSGFTSLPKSWAQGFIIQDGTTYYGLLQKEGGPCGVIASVQAYYIKHFLVINKGNPQSDEKMKQNCVIAAIANILYKVAIQGSQNIVIAMPARVSSQSEAISIDACDQLSYPVKSIEGAYDNLQEMREIFFSSEGVTLFLYSVILTKGIHNLQSEMDNTDNTLIGNHGHCTQELVNLMLTGRAVSNCFDGDKVLDEDYVLHGLHQRSEFGFLTIFEHFKYMEVGSFYKSPIYPVWVICKEYHYSVLFSTQPITEEEQKLKEFDIIFYDELCAPNDRIRLTVRRNGAQRKDVKQNMNMGGLTINLGDEGMVPSLELVMQTKWGQDIQVDWNDSMPIL